MIATVTRKSNKKGGYRQRNVRQFLQGTLFGYITRVTPVLSLPSAVAGAGIWLGQ